MSSPTILQALPPSSLQNFPGCAVPASQNTLETIFNQLITDCNSILLSRLQSQLDTTQWNALSKEIATLVALADASKRDVNRASLIYGHIMLIITSQYLPAVSNFIGDQIAEQASIQNMSSDISAFVIEAESAFNSLSSTPDCNCTESCSSSQCSNSCSTSSDCVSTYNLFAGIMTMVAGTPGSNVPDSNGVYSFSFTVTVAPTNLPASATAQLQQLGLSQSFTTTEANILSFLTDPNIWTKGGGSTPLSTSQASQISTALLGISTIYNSGTDNTVLNGWNTMNLTNISKATCSWTQPFGSSSTTDAITTGNAPLVYTEPATIQADLNTAAQTVEGVATSTQTVENFQVQEIDQFYGITNSIQQSQEQQCASMVKQQTT